MKSVVELHEGWTFKQADDAKAEFLPVAQFPTNVHLDLLANGLIPDPYHGKNELQVQWVAEKVWIYQTVFPTPPTSAFEDGDRAALVFEGLDTYATVDLNGQEILKTQDMFIPERVDITDLLLRQGENELRIKFDSALLAGKKVLESHPEHHWGCWNGDASRLAVRKAQYHYGWDWGPNLNTCGPWRPVKLECYKSRLKDLSSTTALNTSLAVAEVFALAVVEGAASTVRFDIQLGDQVVATETVEVEDGSASASFRTEKPQLWWPAGLGAQPLYLLTATLYHAGNAEDKCSKRFGIRKAEVVQEAVQGEPGKSFYIRVNNVPVFCGGSNWIPADSFIPRISRDRYRNWVRLALGSHQVMLRVWGGGVYEEDVFYDACDELGMLVWQDFLFACGNYPAFPDFLDLVRREAVANVKRLRHHPAIVIWGGNNEDYQYRESAGLEYDQSDHNPQNWLRSTFPARYIYEKLLVDVIRDLTPGTHYHFGSPYGGKDTRDPTAGDIHQWNVWHGSQEPYQEYERLGGRFVSEFGMEALPDVRTIDGYLPDDLEERHPHSSTVEFHHKAAGGERRLATYLVDNLRYAIQPLERYVYCTQVMQADCLGYAYRVWRRKWQGSGRRYCGGALVWQMNDCWPTTSWSLVDSALRPKLAYYAVKREMAPVTVSTQRRALDDPPGSAQKREWLELWMSNLSLDHQTVDVQTRAWDVTSGKQLHETTLRSSIVLKPNQSTDLLENVPVPRLHATGSNQPETVMAVYLVSEGKEIARTVSWPEPLKYVHLPKPKNLVVSLSEDASRVDISTEVPLKSVLLGTDDDDNDDDENENVVWADNGIDVMPGETVGVGVKGLRPGGGAWRIKVRYLGMCDPPL